MSDIPKLQARLARVIEAYGEHSDAAKAARIRLQSAMTEQLMRETAIPMEIKSEQERHAS